MTARATDGRPPAAGSRVLHDQESTLMRRSLFRSSGNRNRQARSSQRRPACGLRLEALEERTLPTTNLYLDFGDSLTGPYGMTTDGTHPVTVDQLNKTYNSANLKNDQSPDAEHVLT